MRRKLFSGAQECIGAEELIRSLMVCMLSARNISGSLRLVMRSVLEGGVGIDRGGRVERSMDMLAFLDSLDVGLDEGGEVSDSIWNGWRLPSSKASMCRYGVK